MSSTAASPWLFSLPFAQFKRDPRFYFRYDAIHFFFNLVVLATFYFSHYHRALQVPLWAFPWVFLLATYLHIVANLFIHNAVHGNFPRPINRVVGELLGLVIITRFASWEIVHRRHHRYSDDRERDPHPIVPNFFRYVVFTITNVEKQLQQEYLDIHGDTPATRRYEKWRARLSYITNLTLLACWCTVLGPTVFLTIFLPTSLLGALFVIHFNWCTHNATSPSEDFKPVNLDTGYYWWGNRIFFGIYMHANHHRMARLFNPMNFKARDATAHA